MLFNSYHFCFLFLPTVLVAIFVFKHHGYRTVIGTLIISSLIFYIFNNPFDIFPLLGSLTFNFLIAKTLVSHKSKPLFISGIIGNIVFLGVFKYFTFFSQMTDLFSGASIALPLAISFYTFQQIAFLTDVYKRTITTFNPGAYMAFICFFPQLIAGPIVHYNDIAPQLIAKETRAFNSTNFSIGLCIFLIGLFKKIVLADMLFTPTSDKIFSGIDAGLDPSFVDCWLGILCYSFQLFFDFSGYSDMAIGLARMFNIKLPINFNSPYKSGSFIAFWRNWHITLSLFLRDYIYIPLGGSRKGRARQYTNLLLVMFIAGLWHGTGIHFVIWGVLHGVFLCLNHLWNRIPLEWLRDRLVYKMLSVCITFTIVTILWSFFRASDLSAALVMLSGLFTLNGIILPEEYNIVPLPFVIFNSEALLINNVFEVMRNIMIGLFIVWVLPNPYQVFKDHAPALYHDHMTSFFSLCPKILTFRFNVLWAFVFTGFLIINILSLGVVDRAFLYFQF